VGEAGHQGEGRDTKPDSPSDSAACGGVREPTCRGECVARLRKPRLTKVSEAGPSPKTRSARAASLVRGR